MYYDLWSQHIKVRKLFKGGNYLRKYGIYYNRSINLQLYNCKNSDIGINFWLDKWAVMMGFTLTIKVLQKLSAFAISALIYNSISARTLILASTSALDKWAVMRGLYAHHT